MISFCQSGLQEFLNIDILDIYFLLIVTRFIYMMTLFSKTFAGFSNHWQSLDTWYLMNFYSKSDYIYDNPILLVKFAAILMCVCGVMVS